MRRGSPARGAWTVVMPVKGGPTAKSRLGAEPRLATAIALDSVAAALGCPAVGAVLTVTGDDEVAAACAALGARVVREARAQGGLDAAVTLGVARARGSGAGPLAVLLADVPALTPADLAAALDAVAVAVPEGCAVVPDAEGTGTVLLAAPRGRLVRPSFGVGSAAAHEAAGAVRLELDVPRLRGDVDDADGLERALALGVGPRTAAALAARSAAPVGRRTACGLG
ncbi:MAG: 2-phospho-L-lactate guanylyltransferase [Kineosporiaceae bacterium]